MASVRLGVNLPWLFGSYGHDLAPNEHHPSWGSAFDGGRLEQPFRDARALGFDAVRIWICEHAEGLVTRGGVIEGVHPLLLERLARVQDAAARHELALYPTLLDANSWKREGDFVTHAIVADPDATARFAERVALPIVRVLDPAQTLALEVLNEPEVMTRECAASVDEPSVGWDVIGRAIATIGDAVRAERPGLRVTSGTMHVFVPHLLSSGARVDAIDVHMYHEDGALPPPAHLAEYAGEPGIATGGIPLFAGECGLPDEAPADAQGRIAHYVHNAARYGYEACFLWRLERTLVTQDAARAVTPAGEAVRRAIADVRGPR